MEKQKNVCNTFRKRFRWVKNILLFILYFILIPIYYQRMEAREASRVVEV